jgi:hypothetical protein
MPSNTIQSYLISVSGYIPVPSLNVPFGVGSSPRFRSGSECKGQRSDDCRSARGKPAAKNGDFIKHKRRVHCIWVNYNDLTATSLESWLVRNIIPKWPYFRLVKYYNLPRLYILIFDNMMFDFLS